MYANMDFFNKSTGMTKAEYHDKAWKDSKYTERQKKLITSSERHTLKSKAQKWIIIGHRLGIILRTKHI